MFKIIITTLVALTFVCQIHAAQNIGNLQKFNEVLPGALYRGGTTTNAGRNPMTESSLAALCEEGFSQAIFVYGKPSIPALNCGAGQISYTRMNWKKAEPLLEKIYNNIQSGNGPIYVHCWYGIHASGYLSAVALRQFCGYSAEEAVSYWDSFIAPSLRYPEVQQLIRKFQPNPNLVLSGSQKQTFCP